MGIFMWWEIIAREGGGGLLGNPMGKKVEVVEKMNKAANLGQKSRYKKKKKSTEHRL